MTKNSKKHKNYLTTSNVNRRQVKKIQFFICQTVFEALCSIKFLPVTLNCAYDAAQFPLITVPSESYFRSNSKRSNSRNFMFNQGGSHNVLLSIVNKLLMINYQRKPGSFLENFWTNGTFEQEIFEDSTINNYDFREYFILKFIILNKSMLTSVIGASTTVFALPDRDATLFASVSETTIS